MEKIITLLTAMRTFMKNKKTTNTQKSIALLSMIFTLATHQITQSSQRIKDINDQMSKTAQSMEDLAKKMEIRNKKIRDLAEKTKSTQDLSKQIAEKRRLNQDVSNQTQYKQLLKLGFPAEIGEQGQQASKSAPWNFELQNKWQYGSTYGFITVQPYYYDEQTKSKTHILQANLHPFQKVRAVVDLSRKIFIDILFNDKLFKKISFRSYATKKDTPFYKTIYLTLGTDGSVYPQTGIYYGLTQTTDSGLDNSQNIPASIVTHQTFSQ